MAQRQIIRFRVASVGSGPSRAPARDGGLLGALRAEQQQLARLVHVVRATDQRILRCAATSSAPGDLVDAEVEKLRDGDRR